MVSARAGSLAWPSSGRSAMMTALPIGRTGGDYSLSPVKVVL
jgi:hypothetical protein